MRLGVGLSIPEIASRIASRIAAVYVLFVPSGSDRLITSGGDVFKVRE